MQTVDLFLAHYDARAERNTVMTKALHLRKIAEHAKLHFMDGDRTCFANAERARVKLQKIFNAQKALGRSLATRKKDMEESCAEGSIFSPEDFEKCYKLVRKSLDGIMQSYIQAQGSGSSHWAAEALDIAERSDVIRNWFMNFMLLLLFAAGGQRPQTYTKLQAPIAGELRNLKEQAARLPFFEVKTLFEKTKRSMDIPNVLVPAHAIKYFDFYVTVMRGAVLRRAKVEESDFMDRPLLMHTEYGAKLRSSQVISCLRSFLTCNVPEMKSITVMALRCSYRTMTMRAFREKRIFPGLSEDDFLGILGKYMNTSPEQLKTTYIRIDRSDFESSARELVRVLDFGNGSSEDDSGRGGGTPTRTENRRGMLYENVLGL